MIDEAIASAQVTVNCHREFTDALAAALGACYNTVKATN